MEIKNTEIEANQGVRIGRPARWNKGYNALIQKYFEEKRNIKSCHMAWMVIDKPGEVPHYILAITSDIPDTAIGSGLAKYCSEKLNDQVPLTDIIYDHGNPMAKVVKLFGKRIYPKRKYGLF